MYIGSLYFVTKTLARKDGMRSGYGWLLVFVLVVRCFAATPQAPQPVNGLRMVYSTGNRPGSVIDLVVTNITARGAVVTWTTPFSPLGFATNEVRISTEPFSAETWDRAIPISGISRPVSGMKQELVLMLEPNMTYFISMRFVDTAHRPGQSTAVVSFKTPAEGALYDPERLWVTQFSFPSSILTTTNVPVMITVDSDISVVEYALSESLSAPPANSTLWSRSLPTNYVFSSTGRKLLVLYMKDAAGNVSSSYTIGCTIDPTPPLPPSSIGITRLRNGAFHLEWDYMPDDNGNTIVRYIVNRNGEDLPWIVTALGFDDNPREPDTYYEYTVRSVDALGRESFPTDPVTGYIPGPDTVAPTIPNLIVPSIVSSNTIPIRRCGGWDNVRVTGYLVKETPEKPLPTDGRWVVSCDFYRVTMGGEKTLYFFAKDAAGNVSAPVSAKVVVDLELPTPPSNVIAVWVAGSTNNAARILWETSRDNVGILFYEVFQGSTNTWCSFEKGITTIRAGLTLETHTFYVRAVDVAGNRSAFASPALLR